MPGIILLDGLAVLGDDDLIDCFVLVIPRPAGALLNAVNAVGQALGGALAILANGNDVSFGILGLVVTASGFQINGECGPFLRLLVLGDGVHCILG